MSPKNRRTLSVAALLSAAIAVTLLFVPIAATGIILAMVVTYTLLGVANNRLPRKHSSPR